MSRKLRIGVIFGGRSGEHEISLRSAQSVLAAIDRDRYDIAAIGIDRHGRWLFTQDPMQNLIRGDNASAEAPQWPDVHQMAGLDVILPVLHGPYGEDGTLQGWLELTDIPYVGCGVLASALAMDKAVSKKLFAAHGLPQTPWVEIPRLAWESQPTVVLDHLEHTLTYPLFTKPANLGSSVGISKARNRRELAAGLDDAAQYDRKLIIEQAVPHAREIEVSVLGNDDPIASVPGEILPSNEFYDYAAKYLDGASRVAIPAPISPTQTETIRAMAVNAFRAVDGSGLSRIDFLLNDATGDIFLNEVNTMPGFTDISMYPKLWEASGLPYPRLIDRLIDLALERHAQKTRNRTTYTPPV